MAKSYTTKKPTGLSIVRSGNYLVVTWKIGDKDYGEGQTFQYRYPKGKWHSVAIGTGTTRKTMLIPVANYYPNTNKFLGKVFFRIRGRRKSYKSGNETINPTVSEWATKDYDVLVPAKPSISSALSSDSDNITTFTWSTVTAKDSKQWFTNTQCQTCLLTDSTITDGAKVPAGYWTAYSISGASGSATITEDASVINNGSSHTRWFRIRSRGPQGVSAWAYSKHVYSVPYQTKSVTASAVTTAAGGYLCKAAWKTPKDAAHPVDKINVQYTLVTPSAGMTCPDGASWTDAQTLAYKDGSDASAFSIDNVVGTDQCLFVRINTVHDRNTTYGNAVVAAVGVLSSPTGLSVSTDTSTYRATVTAANASQVADSFLAVKYMTADDPDGFVVGIIPHGQTSVTVQCPAFTSTSNIKFAVFAVVGSYTATTRADGASSYAVTAKMRSDVVTYGGTIPAAPTSVALAMTDTPGTVRVTFDWAWDEATVAELSWADHADAWESTEEPDTYTINNTHASAWNISGLDTGVTWYVRVRLASGVGESQTFGAYSDIVSIDLSSAPTIPVLALSNSVITEGGTVTASWSFVSSDGSQQAYAEVAEYDGTDYTTLVTVESAQYVTISAEDAGWSTGETHLLAVRVTSASGRQSDDWSDPVSVTVADPLTAVLTASSLVGSGMYSGAQVTFEAEADTEIDSAVVTLPYDADGYTTCSLIVSPTASQGDGTTYVADLNGTIYGGTVDVISGVITSMYDSDGTLLSSPVISNTDGITPALSEGTVYIWSAEGNVYVALMGAVWQLTEMPLTATVTGAGTGGTTRLIIERAETYHLTRPDETDYNGFEGETVAIYSQTGEAQISISEDDLIGHMDDGARYRMIATVQDGLGQSAEVTREFIVKWSHQAIVPEAFVDVRQGQAIAILYPIAPDGALATDTCDIYRLSADKPELIYPGATFGETYVDPYPAIGEHGGHRFVFKTANGDYITADNELAWTDMTADEGDNIYSGYNIIDFGTGRINLEYDIGLISAWSKDFVETKYLGGSVQGDWNPAVSRTGTISARVVVDDMKTLEAMRRLAVYAGVCHVRTKDGSSYAADVQVTENRTQDTAHQIADFTLAITRVDAESYDGMTYSEWLETGGLYGS